MGVTLKQIEQEIHAAYQRRLEIAIGALQKIADDAPAPAEIAQDAIERVKNADKEADLKLDITYRFLRIRDGNSIYTVKDFDYGGFEWEISLTPKERGDLLNSIKLKTIEKRREYDSTADTPG